MATTYTLISSVTVGSGGAANIEFTSIPATYTDLVLKVSARAASGGAVNNNIQLEFNGSSTSKSLIELYGNGSSAASASLSEMRVGYISGSTATASTFGNSELYIPNYAGANNKSSSSDSVSESNTTAVLSGLEANLWSNTAAITSIKIFIDTINFAQYSTAYLYGISNA
jgi:hypothetical protein